MCSRRRLRIAIDGAQSTGKTTLLRAISRHFGSTFNYIPEASRQVAPEFGVSSTQDWEQLLSSPHRLSLFFEREIKWQTRAEDESCRFVVDSSLFLICAYQTAFGMDPEVQLAIDRGYDLILYCPLTQSYHANGFRFFQRREGIDQAYRSIIESCYYSQFVVLPFGIKRANAAIKAMEQVI